MKLKHLGIHQNNLMLGYSIQFEIGGSTYQHSNLKAITLKENESALAREQSLIEMAAAQIADIVRKEILMEIANDSASERNYT